jgi:hypothetical protein
LTRAAKVCLWLTASVALTGIRVTLTAAEKVIIALAETFGLALLRAFTVTDPPAGMVCGALYVVMSGVICELRIDPAAGLPSTAPLTSHVTVVSCAPVTVA